MHPLYVIAVALITIMALTVVVSIILEYFESKGRLQVSEKLKEYARNQDIEREISAAIWRDYIKREREGRKLD